jgi:hypothetical protein
MDASGLPGNREAWKREGRTARVRIIEFLTEPHVAARGVPGERGVEGESKRSRHYARRRLRLCEPEAIRSGAERRDSWR